MDLAGATAQLANWINPMAFPVEQVDTRAADKTVYSCVNDL
jgi:hypothetical protein